MSEQERFFSRANALLDRLEAMLPPARSAAPADDAPAFRWQQHGYRHELVPVPGVSRIDLDDLLCIDSQKQAIVRNTRQFLAGLPANNALLWGPRGTGKSSLLKALLNRYSSHGLRMIEVPRALLADLPAIIEQLPDSNSCHIIYCDDLSFEADDPGYKSLKVILDGSLSRLPDNLLIYATSNRRHLLPEYQHDNEASRLLGGELHHGEAVEEKISLSERFGLWLAFHPFSQDEYLHIVHHWLRRHGITDPDNDEIRQAALRWALAHGSRSGRAAWQFARDWAGRRQLEQHDG